MYDLSTTYPATDTYGGSFDAPSFDDPGCCGGDELYYAQPEPEPVSCCGSPSFELPPEPPAAPVEYPAYEAQSVIPTGQPGGPVIGEPFVAEPFAPEPAAWAPAPEAAMSVIPAGQPGGPSVEVDPTDLYSSMATIGGNPPTEITWVDPAGNEIDPTDLYSSMATIGGNPPTELTWVDPAGNEIDPTYLSPSSVTVGPAQPGSVADNLATIYGVAAQNGDIMSQIGVTRIMDSMHRSALVWTL